MTFTNRNGARTVTWDIRRVSAKHGPARTPEPEVLDQPRRFGLGSQFRSVHLRLQLTYKTSHRDQESLFVGLGHARPRPALVSWELVWRHNIGDSGFFVPELITLAWKVWYLTRERWGCRRATDHAPGWESEGGDSRRKRRIKSFLIKRLNAKINSSLLSRRTAISSEEH